LDRTTKAPLRFIRRLVIPAAVAAWIIAGAGPRMAAANDLSTDPCTAGDVEIVGAGVVVNEPCSCAPGSMFNAQVTSTVRWNTSPGAAGCTTADQNPPGGQCRHQQVCVIGYGATLSCIANCGVSCGATATLQGCVKSPTNRGPFTLTLAGNDGSSQTQSTFGDPSGTT